MSVTLGIMQPYCFPYIGYLQLVNRVDTFVFLDDVHFIKKGWIHRNQINQHGQAVLFSIPLKEASQNRLIHEIYVDDSFPQWREKFFKTLEQSYKKAPQYPVVLPWVREVFFRSDQPKISELAYWSIQSSCGYLNITTRLVASSGLYGENHLKGQDRIIAICQKEMATHYINPIGGVELYQGHDFEEKGIQLSFLKPILAPYPQGKHPFLPWLSILDVLFWNEPPEVLRLLESFELVG